jgi:hypothetical protein
VITTRNTLIHSDDRMLSFHALKHMVSYNNHYAFKGLRSSRCMKHVLAGFQQEPACHFNTDTGCEWVNIVELTVTGNTNYILAESYSKNFVLDKLRRISEIICVIP